MLFKQVLLKRRLAGRGHGKRRFCIAQRAVLRLDLAVERGKLLAGHGQHLDEQRGGVDAVLAGDMPPDGKAAGRFAADDGVRFGHFGRHPLEADGNLIAFLTQSRRNAVKQDSRRIVSHTGTLPAAVFDEVIIEQDEQLVRVDELPLIVDHAEAVRVAVGCNAEIAAPAVHDDRRQRAERVLVRRGKLAAEERVVAVVDDLQIAAAGHEDHAQARLADAIHGIERNAQLRVLDGLHVNGGQNAVDILVCRVVLGDHACRDGGVVVHGFDRIRIYLGDLGLDLIRDGAVRVAATGGEDLDAVVDGRVMAGHDGDAVGHGAGLDHEHHERGRGGAVDDIGPEAITRHDLCRPVRRFLGQESAVIADANFSAVVPLLVHKAAQACDEQADIRLGKFVRNDGSPAAGTEMDHAVTSPFLLPHGTRRLPCD